MCTLGYGTPWFVIWQGFKFFSLTVLVFAEMISYVYKYI